MRMTGPDGRTLEADVTEQLRAFGLNHAGPRIDRNASYSGPRHDEHNRPSLERLHESNEVNPTEGSTLSVQPACINAVRRFCGAVCVTPDATFRETIPRRLIVKGSTNRRGTA